MKNDVVRWTTSSLPTSSPHNSANVTVIETASARTKVSNFSSSIVKHHKSPRRRNLSSSTLLSSLTSYNTTTPLTTTIMTSTSTTNKINRKILNNYCDNSTQLGVSKSTTNNKNNNEETSSKNVWRQSTGRRTLDSERMRSGSSTIFMRPRAFFVDKRTDFTKFLVLCLQISVVLCLCSSNVGVVADDSELEANPSTPGGHFTHTWAVHVPNGEEEGLADRVASDHGFINLGKIFGDHYHFEHSRLSKRSVLPSDHHQKRLDDDDRVHWAKQQIAKRRQKRDFIRMRPSRTSSRSLSLVDSMQFSDPKWPQMWYLNRGGGLDMNVIPAWKEGITGKGVVVTILDDGLESDHPDIDANFDPQASYDVNGHDPDPMPHYDMTDSNRHGTRCAGEVAATANNSICAVGIAYGASVGGVRMLDGDVTDAVEARSLSLNPQHIDIYSASWGPDDDGKTVDGPGELASRAFIEGVTKGRNGKGSIFIWASGNGGRELDNCNCDGYTNSIWTLSISSATEEGHVPWYSEKCSSTLATTYSSGGQSEKQVVTTDLHHSCTVSHTGTSASAPLAAGIAALVLESNSNLTWRDLQHIVVRTAKPANLKDSSWSKNGVGRRISHSFGYGLMDAAAMVQLARNWKTVPEQQRCEINAPHVDKIIPAKGYITLQLTVKHCLSVNYLEHVQAKITLTSHRRGDIQLYLKSPAGTKVTLLTSRVHDVSRSGFSQWPFMSVHTWGESPHGNWQLEIHNEGRYMAQITQWDLIFYGTESPAQPDDPVQISPGQFGSSFGGDMEHNLLEYDPDTASGQWRNVQQVGESLADIQHENDQTSSACMRITLDQRCIECKDPTYLFNGKCYTKCPEQTFAISEVLPTEHDALFNDLDEIQKHMNTRSTLDDALSDDGSLKNMCAICDKSCLHCSGPSPAQCTACFPESRLKTINNQEGFCFVFAERSSGDDKTESKSNWKYVPAVFLLFFIPPMVIVVIVAVSMIVRKRFTSKKDYMYNRVAFNIANEETRALTAEEEEEANADQTNSDKFKSEDLIIPNREQSIPRYKLVVDSESSDSEEDILNLSKT